MKSIRALLFSLLLLFPLIALCNEAININEANKETLMNAIKGVGEKKAAAIIIYREKNGPFKSIDDLANIKGMTQEMVDKHREILTISD